MNLDADVFIENNKLLKLKVPTLCAITRKMREGSLTGLPERRPNQQTEIEKDKAIHQMCRDNLNDLVADLMAVKALMS